MAKQLPEFCLYCHDLLSPIGEVTIKSMFGGYGVYLNKLIIGIIADEQLYLKVTEENKHLYLSINSEPFMYDKNGKKMAMSYYHLPIDILENSEKLTLYATASYEVSRAAQKSKQAKKSRSKRAEK